MFRRRAAKVPGKQTKVGLLLRISGIGGAELSMLQLADGLRRQNIDIVAMLYGPNVGLAVARFPELTVFDLQKDHTLGAAIPFLMQVRRARPDVILSALRHTNILAVMVSRLLSTPVIISEHSPMNDRHMESRLWRERYIRWLMRHIYPKAHAVVVASRGISDHLAAHLPEAGPDLIKVIYNPVVHDRLLPQPASAVHPWLESSRPVVIAMGRLSEEKDFVTLIRGFALLDRRWSARLIILGEGRERAALQNLIYDLGIEGEVLLAGFVDAVSPWLARSSVYVSSSRYEGFGNAIVEAMAQRVPVISTRCPVGPPEILEDGRFGKMVPIGDPKALSRAIDEVLTHRPDVEPAYRQAMRFTERQCVDSYLSLMRSIGVSVETAPPKTAL